MANSSFRAAGSYVEQELPLVTQGDRVLVRDQKYAIQLMVEKYGLLVFTNMSTFSWFGANSPGTFKAGYDISGQRRVGTGFHTSLFAKDLWSKLALTNKSEIPIRNQRIPAAEAQRWLKEASGHYEISAHELANRAHGGWIGIDEELFERWANTDLGKWLGKKYEHLKLTYGDLVLRYLEAWAEENGISPDQPYQAFVQMDMSVSLAATDWDMSVEGIERGFLIALPVAKIGARGTLTLTGGLSEKSQFAVFRMTKLAADIRGSVSGAVGAKSFDFERRDSVPIPQEVLRGPLVLQSPRESYALWYVGIGYLTDDLSFEMHTAQRGWAIEQATLTYSQKVSDAILFYLGAEYRKLSSQITFRDSNIPPVLLPPSDVDRINRDFEQNRDLVAVMLGSFGLSYIFDDGAEVRSVLDVIIGSASLFGKAGVEADIGKFSFDAKMLKYFYFLQGKSNGLRSLERFTGPIAVTDVSVMGNSHLGFRRSQWAFLELGLGYEVGGVRFHPSIIWSPEDGAVRFWSLGIGTTGIEFLPGTPILNAAILYDPILRSRSGIRVGLRIAQ